MEKRKHEHGFKAPTDYFDSLEERLDALMGPESFPDKTGFDVPSGYFDQLEDRVMQQLENDDSAPQPQVIPLYRRNSFRIVASVAALIVLALLVIRPGSVPAIEIQDIDLTQIETYIEEEMDWDEYDLAQMMDDTELEDLETEDLFDDEQLQEYLLENIDDTSLLIE
ncbi:hypothetical protein [Aureitalea marina]|uniref:Uncharacterized protein n=1 Tax=Aureitalea marina TaxID=930804 RepID=A0A2S7KPQ9_9FLAO|nr:hypothetical protein [Aureitalea marina]PQB04601.1 hypothetical protein BST85_06595 [Aureitalea marina]